MKKGIILMVLATLVAGGIFAQAVEQNANSVKNWISGEASLLGAGARYEYMLNDNLSVGANVYWSSFFIVFNDFEVGASARYYIWGKTFFVGAGLGFHQQFGIYNYEYDLNGVTYENGFFGTVSGVAITPEVGWKIDIGQTGGFFIQPGIKLPITFGDLSVGDENIKDPFRVVVGFVAYFGLGYAF